MGVKDLQPELALKALGLELPKPALALANYEAWAIVGDKFVSSGQFPWVDGELKFKGVMGRDLDFAESYAACQLAALNAIAQLKAALNGFDRLRRIYRMEGVLNVSPTFTEFPKALNGASDLLVNMFGERGKHTRMIWTNSITPINSPCLVFIYADVASEAAQINQNAEEK
ncbi:Atu1372/SO_1960 family protein [Undibacterium curvum]|jgi:enamine deaminase RidA (YjgF/YER057c/UK114 family)|uniref:Atu1372/SO_1960 family protein n=1 Tax=Undibacterium curvum TaxID=2762294 RepID=UPI003D0D1B35